MSHCTRCGASIDPLALACTYCGLTTPAGVADKQRREHEAQMRAHYEAQTQYQRQVVEQRRLESATKQSLFFSIWGVVLCCVPTGVIGIVQGFRARSLAAASQKPAPAMATVGIALGFTSVVTTIGLAVVMYFNVERRSKAADERIAQIDEQYGAAATSPVLAREVACALGEQYVLRNGWDGHPGYSLKSFDCVGKLSVTGDERAELDDFRFTWGSTGKYETMVCLKRGAKWYVATLTQGECPP
jgi:hypothetical protein